MTAQTHRRVEFTADIGFGSFVMAFVDFSSQGISFGAPPYNVQIYDGTPEEKFDKLAISEYQRVTVHSDGRVETHLPTLVAPPQLDEFDQDKPSLAQWGSPWSRRFEFSWAPDHIAFSRPWLAKPKPSTDSTCLNVQVEFHPQAVSTVMYVCVVSPETDVENLVPMIPCDGQIWSLTGGWPWVLFQMSNVKCPGSDQLSTVGRDYRSAIGPT